MVPIGSSQCFVFPGTICAIKSFCFCDSEVMSNWWIGHSFGRVLLGISMLYYLNIWLSFILYLGMKKSIIVQTTDSHCWVSGALRGYGLEQQHVPCPTHPVITQLQLHSGFLDFPWSKKRSYSVFSVNIIYYFTVKSFIYLYFIYLFKYNESLCTIYIEWKKHYLKKSLVLYWNKH